MKNMTKTQEKTHIRIKLKILSFLRKLPMTQYELAKAINSDYKAVGQALIYLEKLEKVESVKLKIYDENTKKNKLLWRPKK
jgi:DNA-binding PadR family transcriptional regulator